MNIVKLLEKVTFSNNSFDFRFINFVFVFIVGPTHATIEDLSFYRYKSSLPLNQMNDANFDRCLNNISTNDEHNHYHHELTNTMSESMRL